MRCATLVFLVICSGSAAARSETASRGVLLLRNAHQAYRSGDYRAARKHARGAAAVKLRNLDYAEFIAGQSAFMLGDYRDARDWFRKVRKRSRSRFYGVARARLADCDWELGSFAKARGTYEQLLRISAKKNDQLDRGLMRYRIAIANLRQGRRRLARDQLRAFAKSFPAHPLTDDARHQLAKLAGAQKPSVRAGLERAAALTRAHQWHDAVAVLRGMGAIADRSLADQRDYQLGMTYFKMRRRYEDAGRLLVSVYKRLGTNASSALFHGARALSRADKDREAIRWYQQVVRAYPYSKKAPEAQFLSGWLAYNLRDYRVAIPHLQRMLKRYPRSFWATEARWFLGFCHYLLGAYDKALPHFQRLRAGKKSLVGGKGDYWYARAVERMGDKSKAFTGYRALVQRYPWSWYAQLARARLKVAGIDINVFGAKPRSTTRGTAIAGRSTKALLATDEIARARELIAAGLDVEAGFELRRVETRFLRRHKRDRAHALATLLATYREAGNFNRPWYIAIVYGGSALKSPPTGQAKIWWQHAYPMAYDALIEKHRGEGQNPKYYLNSIMRKETGYNPHVVSYADALGLLQMIPPTTKRVARALGVRYSRDLLFDPDFNIRAASWYIGRLLAKFKGQIPIGSGSYNSGPRPWMKWLDRDGARPMDEFIELVPYRQTREYAKKVTETYARYRYLYDGVIYEQSLTVDTKYIVDSLTY